MKSKKRILAILLGLMISLPSWASMDFPKTHAGIRAGEIVELINSGDPQSIEDYIQNQYAPSFRDAFPLATHKMLFKTTRTMFGQLILVDISKSSPEEISCTLQSDIREAWLNLNLIVEPEESFRILSMGLRPGSRPAHVETGEKEKNSTSSKQTEDKDQQQKEKKTVAEHLEELHQKLTEKAKNIEFSGVVLIAKDGNPIFHNAYGLASKRFNVPNGLDTKFNLGSCNKLFTSIAITQLAEKGKLSLDDPIGKYLDIFSEDVANKVKIRHLLSMRSGWGDFWDNETYKARQNQLRTVSDYMDFIKDMPLDFEPGTNFQHSNTGYDVAGAIIEAVTGMDYYEYIKENIYEPAGMTNSDSFHKDGPIENFATGYTNMNPNDPEGQGYKWNNMYMMPPRGTPAGGGYATAEDLLKFDLALRDYKLLSPDYLNYFFNQFKGSPGDPYIPRKTYRAVGGAPGISAHIGIDLKSGYSVIVLSNYDFPAAMEVAEDIIQFLGL